jgi:very-short-patch-repair endonuclease
LRDAAHRAVKHQYDYGLQELALLAGEIGEPPITELTRRDVAKVFGDELHGERPLLSMLEKWFVLSNSSLNAFFDASLGLRAQIERHMVLNPGDWTVEYLFEEIGALSCSRSRFAVLLADALHPLARRGPDQTELAGAVNEILRRDGYELAVAGEESTYPIYEVRRVHRGVQGTAKNLIFASCGPKPEIGFSNAIDNDIVVLSNTASCLIYDRPLSSRGLRWTELVDWYDKQPGRAEGDPAKALGARLGQSLDSEAEKNLFAAYFKAFRSALGDALPALIPQVYLHYDPAIVKYLRHRLPLKRQRMDFLLLLPDRQRVLIEVDGQHHFAEGDRPSLRAYAEMVSADRELRLAGYEIYRFGANELVGPNAPATIESFFRQLFDRHEILLPKTSL